MSRQISAATATTGRADSTRPFGFVGLRPLTRGIRAPTLMERSNVALQTFKEAPVVGRLQGRSTCPTASEWRSSGPAWPARPTPPVTAAPAPFSTRRCPRSAWSRSATSTPSSGRWPPGASATNATTPPGRPSPRPTTSTWSASSSPTSCTGKWSRACWPRASTCCARSRCRTPWRTRRRWRPPPTPLRNGMCLPASGSRSCAPPASRSSSSSSTPVSSAARCTSPAATGRTTAAARTRR